MPGLVLGRPVRGENFFDRETERRQIWTRLRDGNNLLLLAPRRVGKTSLLYHLQRSAWEEGWLSAYVSVADARDEIGFVDRVVRALACQKDGKQVLEKLRGGPWRRHLEKVRGAIDEVSIAEFGVKLRELPPQEWRGLAEELKRALLTLRRPWLILLDEVPIFITNLLRSDPTAARAREFLTAFRDLRQGSAEQDEDPIHWILAGSIGLDSLARRHRMVDTINDCTPYELGPFTEETAHAFLTVLGASAGLSLSEEVRARLCERAEWLIPHHLQILVAALRDRCEDTGETPTVDLVDAAFETVLGHAYRTYFDHWSVRLEEELGAPDDGYARQVLNVTARDPEGAPAAALSQALAGQVAEVERREETLAWLLDVLARDGYLMNVEGRWRFRSPLLRGYWLRRFTL